MAPVGVCISLWACPVAPEVGDQFGWGVGAHSPLSRRPYSLRCGTACRWALSDDRPRASLALCSVVGETSWTQATTAWRAPVVPARVRGVGTAYMCRCPEATHGSVCVGVGACLHSPRCKMCIYRSGPVLTTRG